jgi:hypothetical protein
VSRSLDGTWSPELDQAPRLQAGTGSASGGIRCVATWNRIEWRDLAVVELPLLALMAIFLLLTLVVMPGRQVALAGHDLLSFSLCPFLAITGIPCLFCGITRSFLAVGGFDFSEAFLLHPLGPIIFFLLAAAAVFLLLSILSRRRLKVTFAPATRKLLIYSAGSILLAAWVIKLFTWSELGLI